MSKKNTIVINAIIKKCHHIKRYCKNAIVLNAIIKMLPIVKKGRHKNAINLFKKIEVIKIGSFFHFYSMFFYGDESICSFDPLKIASD